ncbi:MULTISPECIES: rRNA pseudouridine synthase [unclassified Pseudomonas]|uniref:rRNA pseudouridine synthase n=1 Tax=unclassified Pseudomonas TaxID=196821 RepID=UPI000BDA858A|nr:MULTISPECIES: rRNA pseudouridine synthase [unclassified Pseudomonas]PVZ12484.1 16S rRNA U516 pseudouridylate synthase RsuA-like enzyme [Pseudomonas sp. URIL14HWK12:I12]PVZ23364.1 16S rRNA U516 pseudouridylate synthase RsuA-like enzyme [Pseudomonas sp. URIL14HWK12:I10]PVZ32694.1 16S rRNA U516 pseudouridylate synthase RsuA-like enzyme [Pseudomonas sp. URIL14HWK12:I11]SNZ13848.1 23S rRNA pseudouridine2604 synthase [Pseudomonas sp. URIL14HWK12:I9]
MSEPQRLSRRLIELLGCSRREAELYIEGGWVTVDGEVVDTPQFQVAGQQVQLLPDAKAEAPEPVTFILHQAPGMDEASALASITPQAQAEAFDTGKRVLKSHFRRLQCLAPLQAGASGLQVFSQDWRTARKLTVEFAKLEQEYVVQVSGTLREGGLDRLKRGALYKGQALPKAKASWQNENHLRIAVKAPEPGVIAQLCNAVGLEVISMRRLRLGGVAMGKLAVGQWRYVTAQERF